MIEVDNGEAELYDCQTCDRPETYCEVCPLAVGEIPRPDPRTLFYVRLWGEMKSYGALPEEGGLLDQRIGLMRILNMIDGEVGRARKDRSEAFMAQMNQGANRRGF